MRALILFVGLTAGLVACAGPSGGQTPGADAATAQGFPSLRDVPRTTDANVDAAYWAQVEAELLAVGREMRANPRAQPAPQAETPADFIEDARRDLEQARQAHEPDAQ
ncbi:MAG: hypothetical protein K2P58_06365 [Hyphomonadaceae bacterium]|nr:hypothetical protein [Hyphomonadaceae bacterium]